QSADVSAAKPRKGELLAVWQAPGTPLQQREDAASGLLRTNMWLDELESLLGPPTRQTDDRPRKRAGTPTVVPTSPVWSYYNYHFTNGTIVVAFIQVTNAGKPEATSIGVAVALDAGESEDK